MSTYLVTWTKHNGFRRTSEFTRIMDAVTLCQCLDEEHVTYTLGWVDADNVRHDGCEAIEDKLTEEADRERYLREASEPCYAMPTHYGWRTT